MPKSNTGFWQTKLTANVERDRRTVARLESEGWAVVILWECEIENKFSEVMDRLMKIIL
jgi:DNA mismatch endonuclease, patch repair protein